MKKDEVLMEKGGVKTEVHVDSVSAMEAIGWKKAKADKDADKTGDKDKAS